MIKIKKIEVFITDGSAFEVSGADLSFDWSGVLTIDDDGETLAVFAEDKWLHARVIDKVRVEKTDEPKAA